MSLCTLEIPATYSSTTAACVSHSASSNSCARSASYYIVVYHIISRYKE